MMHQGDNSVIASTPQKKALLNRNRCFSPDGCGDSVCPAPIAMPGGGQSKTQKHLQISSKKLAGSSASNL